MANKAGKWKKSKEYTALKKDLLEDLESRGLIGKQYTDKVEEYMDLWCILKMLNEDVLKRGVFVEYSNGATQKGTTENKSLSNAVRVSSQMLNIWSALGFREQAVKIANGPVGGEDDDL